MKVDLNKLQEAVMRDSPASNVVSVTSRELGLLIAATRMLGVVISSTPFDDDGEMCSIALTHSEYRQARALLPLFDFSVPVTA